MTNTVDIGAEVERLRATDPGSPREARDPVNQPMINNWVEAIGDQNPVYVDAEAARSAGFARVVAPPAMTQTWTMPGLGADRSDDHPTVRLFDLLDSAGYTSIVATNADSVYHRYVAVGEHLTLSTRLSEIVGPKQTALGEGWFCTTRNTWTVAGETVAEMEFRMLKFRPGGAAASDSVPQPPQRKDASAGTADADVPTVIPDGPFVVGSVLPELEVLATPTFIVSAALATRDFQEVHHDRDIARARGSQDIFANILTDTGLVQRYVSQALGYYARFTAIKLRLGVPWYANDTLGLTGRIEAVDGPCITAAVTGMSSLGPHILATVGLGHPEDLAR